MEGRDGAPLDVLGCEAALAVLAEVGVEPVHTHQVRPAVSTGKICVTIRTAAVTESGVHHGGVLQGGGLAADAVELVAQNAQHAGAVADHDGAHPGPGEAVKHTARHGALG